MKTPRKTDHVEVARGIPIARGGFLPVRGRILCLVVVLVVLAVASGIVRRRRRLVVEAETIDLSAMKSLLICTKPDCRHVVEWTGDQVIAERNRTTEEDKRRGGMGYPAVKLACPDCGGALASAERTASGEVRPVGRAASPSGGVSGALPGRGGKDE